MDNRRTLILMLVLVPLIMFWNPVFNAVLKQLGYDPLPVITDNRPTTATSTQTSGDPAVPVSSGATSIGAAPVATTGLRAAPATQPDASAKLGSIEFKDITYRMGLQLSSRGAGLDSVVLNEFKQNSKDPTLYTFQQPYPQAEKTRRALGTQAITVNGTTIDLSNTTWELEQSDSASATFGVTILSDAGTPLLRVRKKFELAPKTDPTSQGYEVLVNQSFQNLGTAELRVSTLFNGPTLPPAEAEKGVDLQTLAGFAAKGFVTITHEMASSLTGTASIRDFSKDKENNPNVWAGTSSTYFNAILQPLLIGDAKTPTSYIVSTKAESLKPDEPAHPHVILAFTTADQVIAAGSTVELPMRAFFGPRQRKVLNSEYYSAFPRAYDQTLVLTSGPCGFCTFQWLINILVRMLDIFHTVLFKDWGLAIIALVVLVRALLHPITKRSQISMAKMSKMGPEMEKLKVKYKDQPDELNKAMMQFYKTQGATPILGCLPMFLQMPIWLALWQALNTTFELRQAPFLHFFGIPFTWISDLSKPDHLIPLAQPFDIFFLHISGLNLLPFLLGIVFFVQMKMQPKPASETPEQMQQRKMMQWMSLLFPIMLYSGPSGLNLYIMTSTAIGIVESKIVRDHLKQREEAEAAGRVIIDPGTKFRGGGGGGATAPLGRKPDPDKPTKGLMKWLNDLQQKADQIRKDAEKKK